MNILAVDAGNTRIKWGLHDGQDWITMGAVGKQDTVRLSDTWKLMAPPTKIVISNVAGELIRSELSVLMGRWRVAPQWITAQSSQCGVANGYQQPAQLGCDRWAALIGAHHRHAGAAIVIMAGTAVTIDALSAGGKFLGGFILPGPEMMVEALNTKTAGVRVERGEFENLPTNTRNAVWSAAIQATAGAVDRLHDRLVAVGEKQPLTLLSGGAAETIEPYLYAPVERIENLVLEGLIHIAVMNTTVETI
ncbi:MAG TPA: type III pantothenate kinase [Burkholderiales bacterium]|nr:type III pantothenate kinase [Burkholderiales bacterium]